MPIQLLAPIYKTSVLEKTDAKYNVEGDATIVTVKQATQREHEQRQQLFSTLERKFKGLDSDEITLVQHISMEELKKLEVWLTLCECNILGPDGKDLFPSRKGKNDVPQLALTRRQFDDSWGSLPPDVADEIHEKVLEVNFLWSGQEGEVL